MNNWKPYSEAFTQGLEKLGFDILEHSRLDLHPDDWKKIEDEEGTEFVHRAKEAMKQGHVILAVKKRPPEEIEANHFAFTKLKLDPEIDGLVKTTRNAFSRNTKTDEFLKLTGTITRQINDLPANVFRQNRRVAIGIVSKYAEFLGGFDKKPKTGQERAYIDAIISKADQNRTLLGQETKPDKQLDRLLKRIGIMARRLRDKINHQTGIQNPHD